MRWHSCVFSSRHRHWHYPAFSLWKTDSELHVRLDTGWERQEEKRRFLNSGVFAFGIMRHSEGSTLSSDLRVVTEKWETTNQTNWRWRRYHVFPFILYQWFLNFPGEDSGAIPLHQESESVGSCLQCAAFIRTDDEGRVPATQLESYLTTIKKN